MAKAKKKAAWSKTINEAGVSVRIYEHDAGGNLYREYRDKDEQGQPRKDRQSLKTRDRAEAEERARAFAREMARHRLEGRIPTGPLALGELFRLYLHHRGPQLRPNRKRTMKTTAELFLAHLGAGFRVEHFDQHRLDTYLEARRSGRVQPNSPRAKIRPRDGTLNNELWALRTICSWAMAYRHEGRPLLSFNPVRGLRLPQEQNPVRPVASDKRYRALLAVAGEVDPSGALAALLVIARHTGRRINAILHLRRSDVLFTEAEMRRAMAEEGYPERAAEAWAAVGAFRWRAEWDKKGYFDFSPMNSAVRAAVEEYLRRRPVIGEGWIFPSSRDPSKPLSKCMAAYFLSRGEEAAELPPIKQGGWHAFRRLWATERRDQPLKDVMAGGGWRDVKALQTAYQHADPETVLRVVERSAGGGNDPVPAGRKKARAGTGKRTG